MASITLYHAGECPPVYAIAGKSSLCTGRGYAEIAYARPLEYFGTISCDF